MVSPAPALGTVRVPSLRKPGSPARPGLGKDSLIKAEVHKKTPQLLNYPLQCPPGTLLHHQRLRNVPKGRVHSPCLILKRCSGGFPHQPHPQVVEEPEFTDDIPVGLVFAQVHDEAEIHPGGWQRYPWQVGRGQVFGAVSFHLRSRLHPREGPLSEQIPLPAGCLYWWTHRISI